MHLISLSMPMNVDLALFALRLGLFLVFVYEGWSKLADVKGILEEHAGGSTAHPRDGRGSFSDRWAS